jgi:uncharacterized protein (DUF362 family)
VDVASVVGSQDGPMALAEAGLVLASGDRVACDSLGLAVLKHYARQLGVEGKTGVAKYVDRSVWEDAQIKRAAELGLGLDQPELIEIADSGVNNISDILAEWV